MNTAITVKKQETAWLSWGACFGLLGVSVYLVHRGLHASYSESVANVLTLAFVFLAWLNWQAVKRWQASTAAGDDARKWIIAALSFSMAAGEAWLSHLGFLDLAKGDGATLSLATAVGFAIALAAFNLWGKYGFVNPIAPAAAEPSIDTSFFDEEPPPAQHHDAGANVHFLDRVRGAARDADHAGIRDIVAGVAKARAAEWASLQERKDPATGQWRKAEKPKRRRAA
jgi:hypothetical protein